MHSSVTKAIILVAGRGRRMDRLTDGRPKCLLEVAGMPILERTLKALLANGISEAILIVGYNAEQIISAYGHRFAGICIEYVLNELYDETNTTYSLWLARERLDSDCLLIEGDISIDAQGLRRILDHAMIESTWAAIPIDEVRKEGILLGHNDAGYITELKLVRKQEDWEPRLTHKCAGIQFLKESLARSFSVRLDEAISQGQTRTYADIVLWGLVQQRKMQICSLAGLPWAEVDDQADYRRAQKIFSSIDREPADHAVQEDIGIIKT